MSTTRRKFIKAVAVAGAVVTACSSVTAETAHTEMKPELYDSECCPYFDQPLFCKGQSKTGQPLCEE